MNRAATQKGRCGVHAPLLRQASEVLKMGMLAGSLWSGWACAGVTANRLTVTPSRHTVTLSWAASTTDGVAYNIYRAPYTNACASFLKINDGSIPGTSYIDFKVVNGSSYCYGVKSINSSNQESNFSNIVLNVQVPAN